MPEIRQGMKVSFRGETGYVLAFYEDGVGSYSLNLTTGDTTASFTRLTEKEVKKIKILEK